MNPRRRPSPPPIRVIGGGLAVLFVAGLWYLTLAPSRFGGPLTPVLVRGVSMEPTYSTGDLVLAYRGTPAIGDVVAYRHAEGAIVIHRLVEVTADGYVTQGDNVASPDPWVVTPEDVLGSARMVIPGFSRRVSWVTTPGVSAAFAGAVAFVVVLIPSPAEKRWRARRAAGRGGAPSRRTVTVATLAMVATLAPVTGAAAALLIQAWPLTHLSFDAADACTYNVSAQNTCTGNGGGGGGGGGGGPTSPGRP